MSIIIDAFPGSVSLAKSLKNFIYFQERKSKGKYAWCGKATSCCNWQSFSKIKYLFTLYNY
ncbi:MAG: hypothetical protein PHW56_08280, partial [Methanosarcinaceae archaeon]|nr:hypothetical protein [Methanosarcinaceae archaeon]